MPAPLVNIQGLNIFFKTTEVLSNFNLQIQAGEIVSVVGESGSGKSISALMSMGLLSSKAAVNSTCAEVLGRSVLHLSVADWQTLRGKEIAMIFQDPMTALHPSIRIGKQLEEVLETHTSLSGKQRKIKVLKALEGVSILQPEISVNKYPHEMSGGQRQRVVIAMAMLLEPKLIIADEPTTALDKEVEATVLELLSKLVKEKGCALWFISHDLEVVSEFSDRVLVLYKGKTVEQGSAKEVFNTPKHPYTKGLLACRPPKNGRPYPLPVLSDFLEGEGTLKASELAAPKVNTKALYVEGLNIGYKVRKGWKTSIKWVVRDLDLQLNVGETLGLIGPSGSGKSSVGRAVVDLVPATFSIRNFEGNEGRVQFIFQDPSSALNRSHTIGRILDQVLSQHAPEFTPLGRKDKASALLQEVGLHPSDLAKKPKDFSGGQRQRIGIARALAADPTVLICDESVSALDVSVQAQVLNLLNGIKKNRGLSMIFISHDPNVVRYMCDRIQRLD
ncbi:MAG TPA: ABC transporter ATP-binding protein [Cryomorphaceae bacterium]|nr:ABC transporter ATP-binding protein [Cryomorphaceae bacterium]